MTSDLTFRDYFEILRRRAWLVGSFFVGALVIALVWVAFQTPQYESSARILINQNTANEIFDPVTGAPTNTADRVATNEVELLKSQLVRTEAEARLGFSAEISARAESRADIVVVTASDPDPVVAQSIAQTYAESYLDVRRNEYVAERLDTAEKLLERIRQVEIDIADAPVGADTSRQVALRDDLADSYDRLTITADLGNNGSARIIDDANVPVDPTTPKTDRDMVVAGLLGLLVGAGAAVLIENVDTSIKSRQVIEELTPGLPALAMIPEIKTRHEVIALERPEGLETEVFRTLRASIEFAAVDRSIQVIQITSAGPSAGKTTVTANLAVVMAQSGQRVAVVDCDLRRPRLHNAFGLEQVPGISSVIIGRESGAAASHALNLNNGRLWVFPSGPIPPGPSELLGSERALKTFTALRRSVDVIIVDSPPVLPVSDALVLSRLADATIVVANARSTKRDELVRALDQLEQAGATVIGTVLNNVKANANQGYGYGYGYGYNFDERRNGRFARSGDPAPRIDGTAVLNSTELPRFEIAKRASSTGADGSEGSDKAFAKGIAGLAWLEPEVEPVVLADDGPGSNEERSSEAADGRTAAKRRGRLGREAGATEDTDSKSTISAEELEGWSDEFGVK